MPSQQKIEQFKLWARARGYSESRINAEIMAQTQKETKSVVSPTLNNQQPTMPQQRPIVQPVSQPTPQPTTQPNTLQKIGKAAIGIGKSMAKPFIETAKSGASAVETAKLLGTSKAFRKSVSGQKLTPAETRELATYKSPISRVTEQRNYVKDAAKQVAGTASYAVPFGKVKTGLDIATKAVIPGAISGGLSAYSEDDANLESVVGGAVLGGGMAGLTGLTTKALKSQAAKKVGTKLVNMGEDIQLSTYTKNLGKPIKAEGGRDLLVRMKKVGIKAADPDTVVEQANKILTDDGGIVYEATKRLSKKGVKVPVNQLTEGLKKQIAASKSSVTKKPLQEVLEIIETDLAGQQYITPDDLYLLKTEYGGLGRWSSLSSAVEKKQAEAWRDVYIKANDIIDDTLKAGGFKDFKVINERLHTAMQASQYAARSGNVAPNKYNVGLYDWMGALTGAAATGNPLGIGVGYAAKTVFESPATKSLLGRIMERAGNAAKNINPINVNIPSKLKNVGIVGATKSVIPNADNEGNDTYNNESDNQLTDQIDLQNSIDNSTTTDNIPQMSRPGNPRFNNMTRDEVKQDAYNSGLNIKQVNEVLAFYDETMPESDTDYIKELITTRKTYADQGFSTEAIDRQLEGVGVKRMTPSELSTNEYAPAVTRSLKRLEQTSGIGTKDSIFKGGSTTIGKKIKGAGVETKKATDGQYNVKVNQYKNSLNLIVGAVNQMLGAGVLNDGEAKRLIDSMPNEYSSEAEAKAWFEDARFILGVE